MRKKDNQTEEGLFHSTGTDVPSTGAYFIYYHTYCSVFHMLCFLVSLEYVQECHLTKRCQLLR